MRPDRTPQARRRTISLGCSSQRVQEGLHIWHSTAGHDFRTAGQGLRGLEKRMTARHAQSGSDR